jgi:hypothetical protein
MKLVERNAGKEEFKAEQRFAAYDARSASGQPTTPKQLLVNKT